MGSNSKGPGPSSVLIGADRAGNVVGIDPHKRTLTAIVIDARGGVVAGEHFRVSGDGHRALEAWALSLGAVARWGVENASGWGRHTAIYLAGAGHDVRDVCPNRTRASDRGASAWQVRHAGWRADRARDARAPAAAARLQGGPTAGRARRAQRAAQAPPRAAPVAAQEPPAPAQRSGVPARRTATAAARLAARHQGRAPAAERAEGSQPQGSLGRPDRAAAEDPRRAPNPDRATGRAPSATSPSSWRCWSATADTTLDELCGLATRSVAELLIEVGDPRRFTEGGFARFNGTAPLAASTAEGPGEPVRHRFNPGGNRRVNAILHRMAVTQLRCEPRAQAIYANARARGHTKTRGAAHPQAPPLRRHPPPHDTRPPAPRRPCPLGRLTAPTRDAVTGAARQGPSAASREGGAP